MGTRTPHTGAGVQPHFNQSKSAMSRTKLIHVDVSLMCTIIAERGDLFRAHATCISRYWKRKAAVLCVGVRHSVAARV